MDIRIKATDLEMTSDVRKYLDDRLAHLARMLGPDESHTRCEVEVGRDAGRPRHGANIWFAEMQLIYPGGRLVRATNRSESINGAIDDAKAELERQLRREKKLHIRVLRKSGAFAKRFLRFGSPSE